MGANIHGGIGSAVYVMLTPAIYIRRTQQSWFSRFRKCFHWWSNRKALVTLLSETELKTVIVPMDNLSVHRTLPTSILGKTDVPFYGNSQMLLQKISFRE